MSDGKRTGSAAGQSTTEYVVLMGVTTGIGLLVFSALGGSVREALRTLALGILSTVIGTP
jgi:hypothetical protein